MSHYINCYQKLKNLPQCSAIKLQFIESLWKMFLLCVDVKQLQLVNVSLCHIFYTLEYKYWYKPLKSSI